MDCESDEEGEGCKKSTCSHGPASLERAGLIVFGRPRFVDRGQGSARFRSRSRHDRALRALGR